MPAYIKQNRILQNKVRYYENSLLPIDKNVITDHINSSTISKLTNKTPTENAIINSLSPGQGYSLTSIDLEAVYNKYS